MDRAFTAESDLLAALYGGSRALSTSSSISDRQIFIGQFNKRLHTLMIEFGSLYIPILEMFMSLTVVLTIGFDPWFFEAQRTAWRSAGYFITSTGSIGEAIEHFMGGDFDLVLLGDSIPAVGKERLTYLIRASGSSVPVVSITDTGGLDEASAGETTMDESRRLLQRMRELLANHAVRPAAKPAAINDATTTRGADTHGPVRVRHSSAMLRAGWVA